MKEFDLELAKAGHPVQTRDGRKARIICWDAKGKYPIIALIAKEGKEVPTTHTLKGKYNYEYEVTDLDIVMASEKHEGWINLYKDNYGDICTHKHVVYDSKEDALAARGIVDYFATIKIEWED